MAENIVILGGVETMEGVEEMEGEDGMKMKKRNTKESKAKDATEHDGAGKALYLFTYIYF